MSDPADDWYRLPAAQKQWLAQGLQPDESVSAVFRHDLGPDQRYRSGVLLLTSRRLLWALEPAEGGGPLEPAQSVSLAEVTDLQVRDRGGLGQVEAFAADRRLGIWYYTIARADSAKELLDAWSERKEGRPRVLSLTQPEEVEEGTEATGPATLGSLLRLLGFVKHRAGHAFWGAVLTVLTTLAGMIPPIYQKSLIDDFIVYDTQQRVAAVAPLNGAPAGLGRVPDAAAAPAQAAGVAEAAAGGAEAGGAAAADNPNLANANNAAGQPPPAGTVTLTRPVLRSRVTWYLGMMLLAGLLSWGFAWAQGWVLACLSERISADLRNRTYEHLQRLSLDFFSAKRTGDLVARISSDTDRICSFLSDNLMDFVTDLLTIVWTIGVLFWMDRTLALATLVTFPLVAWLTYSIRNRLTHGFSTGYRAWGDMTSILADTIPGIRVVKAFAQEQREVERFADANRRIIAANDRVNVVWTFFWPMVTFLNRIGLIVVLAVGSWLILGDAATVTIGTLFAFNSYIGGFYSRLESMSRMATSTQRAAASAQRIFEILDRVPSVPEPTNPVHIGRLRGEIDVQQISFRYGNRQVMDNVSLTIAPGEMIGLVGTTGAGKSTLVNLVCRFHDVSSGRILVDGHDVRQLSVADYRRNIGIVLQEPFLFFGTIAENIAYGRPEATRAEIIAAARAARAHEFILRLPDGYDSIVGERGQTLSGGERQRVSIARAQLIDQRILILDEATSAVDTTTEQQIQEALDNLVRGRTTIAIAHRLSTLRQASRLVVLEHGRVVECGPHDELLARNGKYAQLYRAQLKQPLAGDPQPPVAEDDAPDATPTGSSRDLTRDLTAADPEANDRRGGPPRVSGSRSE
ncbi:MAG: ABC transporter ATP-binding protein [Planctomycetaceae bacterium]